MKRGRSAKDLGDDWHEEITRNNVALIYYYVFRPTIAESNPFYAFGGPHGKKAQGFKIKSMDTMLPTSDGHGG